MGFSEFTKPRFMLCEGDDDKGVLESIIGARCLPDFQICHAAECNPEHTGGRSGFVKALRGIEPLSGFSDLRALLLVTDNDSLESSFAEAQKALTDRGYTPPASPDGIGHVAGKPVAILMIPRADMEGNLELLALPAIHEVWPEANGCVESFLQCTGANMWSKKGSLHKARARSAILGYNESDPYKGIGHLFRNGTLSAKHRCFNEISDFLRTFDARVGI